MPKIFVYIVFISVLVASCVGNNSNMRKAGDFDFLEKGMSFQEIVGRVGKPDAEIGSGGYVYVYDIGEQQSVVLYFLQIDSLNTAQLLDNNNDIIKTLVSP